jgi:hypothetical protein
MSTIGQETPTPVPGFRSGQLLSALDLNTFARWAQQKFERGNRQHGWGVTVGLRLRPEVDENAEPGAIPTDALVKESYEPSITSVDDDGGVRLWAIHTSTASKALFVTAGSAIDADGHELLWSDQPPIALDALLSDEQLGLLELEAPTEFVVWLHWKPVADKRRHPYLRLINETIEDIESTPPHADPGKAELTLAVP